MSDYEIEICVFCSKECENGGNNCEMLGFVGHPSCCDECNMRYVIPVRLAILRWNLKH